MVVFFVRSANVTLAAHRHDNMGARVRAPRLVDLNAGSASSSLMIENTMREWIHQFDICVTHSMRSGTVGPATSRTAMRSTVVSASGSVLQNGASGSPNDTSV